VVGVQMSDISITYDLLFDILRIEKSREDLQKIDDKFYINIVEYLHSKEAVIDNPNTPHGERELTKIQLGNVKKLLVELYDRREKKIINLAIYKIKTGSGIISTQTLLEEEKPLFDSVHAQLSRYRSAILYNVIEGKDPTIAATIVEPTHNLTNTESAKDASEDSDYDSSEGIKSVRFTKSVPRFMGPELETYGPFEENDIASLPSKIANILLRKERAEEMKLG
jgi:DNA replication initiation complex subunit (GINS family)